MKDSAAILQNGQIIGWSCKYCKLYNDILENHCKACYVYKPEWLTTELQIATEFKRGIFYKYGCLEIERNLMTPQEELFSNFYNSEKIEVKAMDEVKLRDHIETLEQIAFEAKARLVAAKDETRERNAKNKVGKEWITPVSSDQVSSDAVNVVTARKGRMNKIEKLRAQLVSAGLDKDTIDETIRNLEKKATDKNLKTITFQKPSVEISAVQVKIQKEESEPFDPSKLFG